MVSKDSVLKCSVILFLATFTISCIGSHSSNGMSVCVQCVRVCVCVCMHACVCVHARACLRVRACVCSTQGRDRVSASIALVVVISLDGGASDRLQ